jgi:opacity protein-like surface antigen
MRIKSAMLLTAVSLIGIAPAGAQSAVPQRSTVLSFQPLSAMLTLYAGEIEQRVGSKVTIGAGGSHWAYGSDDEFKYTSGDLKLRFYPEGHALTGFAFGIQGGYTKVSESFFNQSLGGEKQEHTGGAGTAGVSVDYNLLLGESRSYYLGIGAGAKKLFIDSEKFHDPTFAYPTARLSLGYAF